MADKHDDVCLTHCGDDICWEQRAHAARKDCMYCEAEPGNPYYKKENEGR